MNVALLAADAITPTRNFNVLYIIVDSVFIAFFLALLIWKKRYQTAIFAVFGGVLYTIVDYCGFYLLSGSRTVSIDGEVVGSGMTFAVLLWMSMSYGITNFAFIWVLVAKDKLSVYWIFLIVVWWLIAPSIAELGGEPTIQTYRTTGAYHGWMGVVMIVGYFLLAVLLMRHEKRPFVSILRLFAIGFFVQFGWEFALLINGIRPMNGASIQTLLVNSCLETNLGMPIIFLIFYVARKYRNEDLTKADRNTAATIGAVGCDPYTGLAKERAPHWYDRILGALKRGSEKEQAVTSENAAPDAAQSNRAIEKNELDLSHGSSEK